MINGPWCVRNVETANSMASNSIVSMFARNSSTHQSEYRRLHLRVISEQLAYLLICRRQHVGLFAAIAVGHGGGAMSANDLPDVSFDRRMLGGFDPGIPQFVEYPVDLVLGEEPPEP